MSEHVHEWLLGFQGIGVGTLIAVETMTGARCTHCKSELSVDEVVRRLNATEKLRREAAIGSAHALLTMPIYDAFRKALLAYAAALEGKE